MTAMSEANKIRGEAASKEQDLKWHQEQLCKAREQLLEARQEAGQLHISMSNMVPKSVLSEVQAATESYQVTVKSLQEKLRNLQHEKAELQGMLQVSLRHA
jgi:hypothetical protein